MHAHTEHMPATAQPHADPGTGTGAEATTAAAGVVPPAEPMAVIVITVRRNSIEQHARLVMGGTHSANRSWFRLREGSEGWACRDAEFMAAEDRIGLELAEYMEGLALPNRVASMLPRPASPDAAAKAAEEVRRG